MYNPQHQVANQQTASDAADELLGHTLHQPSHDVAHKKKEKHVHKGRRQMDDSFMMYLYKIKLCTRQTTHNWKLCPWAHPGETAALRRHPSCHEAELCPAVRMNQDCPHGETCSNSRNAFECWLHPDRYRTTMCSMGEACNRNICFFAHNPSELRTPAPTSSAASAPMHTAPVQLETAAQMQAAVPQQLLPTSSGAGTQTTVGSPWAGRSSSTGNATTAAVSSAAANVAGPSPGTACASAAGCAAQTPKSGLGVAESPRAMYMGQLAALQQQHQRQLAKQHEEHEKQLVLLKQQQEEAVRQLKDVQVRETAAVMQQLQLAGASEGHRTPMWQAPAGSAAASSLQQLQLYGPQMGGSHGYIMGSIQAAQTQGTVHDASAGSTVLQQLHLTHGSAMNQHSNPVPLQQLLSQLPETQLYSIAAQPQPSSQAMQAPYAYYASLQAHQQHMVDQLMQLQQQAALSGQQASELSPLLQQVNVADANAGLRYANPLEMPGVGAQQQQVLSALSGIPTNQQALWQ